jgi:hypothetical protein
MSDSNSPNAGKLTLSNKAYNILKPVALIWLPAIGVLYVALAALWGLPKPTEVVATITAVDLFLGTVLGISTRNFKNSEGDKDGVLVVNQTDPEKDNYSFEVDDLGALANKDVISLKVRHES